MVTRFSEQVRDALDERSRAALPPVGSLVAGVLGGTVAYILLALLAAPSGEGPEYHFQSEGGAVTALSAIFLAMASSFSLAALTAGVKRSDKGKWLWALMAGGFGFLALDELLQFHERVGRVLERMFSSGPFRNWNDVVVIGYGLLAVPLVVAFLPGILRYRLLLELFVIALFFYGLHTVIDSTQEPPTTLSMICEESAKLICGAFLALGAFTGFLGEVWNIGRDQARRI